MNAEEKSRITREAFERRFALSEKKCMDYADPNHVLWNFEVQGKVCRALGINPSEHECDTYLFLAVLKLIRLCNLLHAERAPENESVADTIDDMQNYLDLLRCYLHEKADAVLYMADGRALHIEDEKSLSQEVQDKLARYRESGERFVRED